MRTDSPAMASLRRAMIDEQLRSRGIADLLVLKAFEEVPRHFFVLEEFLDQAYEDRPLMLGPDQTISQPFIVAYMLEQAGLKRSDKVLEIGSGSGWQAALLSRIVDQVCTIELDTDLSKRAEQLCFTYNFKNIKFLCGDGFQGWPEEAPFDVIIVSACPDHIPRELHSQLRENGRLLLPLGNGEQELLLLEKSPQGLKTKELGEVRFVPMREPEGS